MAFALGGGRLGLILGGSGVVPLSKYGNDKKQIHPIMWKSTCCLLIFLIEIVTLRFFYKHKYFTLPSQKRSVKCCISTTKMFFLETTKGLDAHFKEAITRGLMCKYACEVTLRLRLSNNHRYRHQLFRFCLLFSSFLWLFQSFFGFFLILLLRLLW